MMWTPSILESNGPSVPMTRPITADLSHTHTLSPILTATLIYFLCRFLSMTRSFSTPSMHTGSLQYGQSGSNFEKAAIDLLSVVINKWEIERE